MLQDLGFGGCGFLMGLGWIEGVEFEGVLGGILFFEEGSGVSVVFWSFEEFWRAWRFERIWVGFVFVEGVGVGFWCVLFVCSFVGF